MDLITPDSFILVYRDRRRRWIVKPRETPKLHTHLGILDCSALVGKEFGIKATTSLNDELVILRPTIEDLIIRGARLTQIVYPKDLGLIMLKCGVHSGSQIVESGTGSGATTALLAYLALPAGHVYSYDINGEFQSVARRNLERLGLIDFVTLKTKDAKAGFDERYLDAGVLDVGNPEELVFAFREALRPSGVLAGITPTTNQTERLVERMTSEGFVAIETVEVLLRYIEARVGRTRPSNAMIGHTAYITFGRKTS